MNYAGMISVVITTSLVSIVIILILVIFGRTLKEEN
jgi:hypothetical protein